MTSQLCLHCGMFNVRDDYDGPVCFSCGWRPKPEPPTEITEGRHMTERNAPRNYLTPEGRSERDRLFEGFAEARTPIYLVADKMGISVSWAKKKMAEARRRVR